MQKVSTETYTRIAYALAWIPQISYQYPYRMSIYGIPDHQFLHTLLVDHSDFHRGPRIDISAWELSESGATWSACWNAPVYPSLQPCPWNCALPDFQLCGNGFHSLHIKALHEISSIDFCNQLRMKWDHDSDCNEHSFRIPLKALHAAGALRFLKNMHLLNGSYEVHKMQTAAWIPLLSFQLPFLLCDIQAPRIVLSQMRDLRMCFLFASGCRRMIRRMWSRECLKKDISRELLDDLEDGAMLAGQLIGSDIWENDCRHIQSDRVRYHSIVCLRVT